MDDKLWVCFEYQDWDGARELVRKDPGLISSRGYRGGTFLHRAARCKEANPLRPYEPPYYIHPRRMKEDESGPEHHAVIVRYEALLDMGFDVNAISDIGETPLDQAYAYANKYAISTLLKRGASVRLGIRPWLGNGWALREPWARNPVTDEDRMLWRAYYLSLLIRAGGMPMELIRLVVRALA